MLARLPLVLYDLRVSRLLGHRFLVVAHRGRTSGRRYRTVLEGRAMGPERREATVASGWGARANWYRNLRAALAAEILIGGERFTPEQRFLDLEDRIEVPEDYRRVEEHVGTVVFADLRAGLRRAVAPPAGRTLHV